MDLLFQSRGDRSCSKGSPKNVQSTLIIPELGEGGVLCRTVGEQYFLSCEVQGSTWYYNKNQVKIENGFVEVNDVPTGCMLIDKRAMSIIINKNRDSNYINNCSGYGNSKCFYDLFKTGVKKINGKKIYLSEDYYFLLSLSRMWHRIVA